MKYIDVLDVLLNSTDQNSHSQSTHFTMLYLYFFDSIIAFKIQHNTPHFNESCYFFQKEYNINMWNLNTDDDVLYNIVINSHDIYSISCGINVKRFIQSIIEYYESDSRKPLFGCFNAL